MNYKILDINKDCTTYCYYNGSLFAIADTTITIIAPPWKNCMLNDGSYNFGIGHFDGTGYFA